MSYVPTPSFVKKPINSIPKRMTEEKPNTYALNILLGPINKIILRSYDPDSKLKISVNKYSHDENSLLNDSCVVSFNDGLCVMSIISNPLVCESDLAETMIEINIKKTELIKFDAVQRHKTGKEFFEYLKDICQYIEYYLEKSVLCNLSTNYGEFVTGDV